MKITAVNTYYVRPRWGFVEIETDEGYTGWGEAVLEGHADAVLACLNEYKPYLIGKDPSRIEDLSATIYRAGFYRGGGVMMSALSGIDQALWDIKGKVFNAPVYELMAGAAIRSGSILGSAETVPLIRVPWLRSAWTRASPLSR